MNLGYWGQETVESAFQRLKDEAAYFSDAYNVLLADYEFVQDDPALFEKWSRLKSIADTTKDSVQYIFDTIEGVGNWFSNVFGLGEANNLGAIPVIGIATILSAIAAIGYIGGEIYKFHNSNELKAKMLAAGYNPEQIIDAANAGQPSSALTDVKGIASVLVFGAVAVLVVPKLLERFKK